MGRLIIVSNRLPFSLRRQAQEIQLVRSAGGLVAGLGPIHEAQDSLWIGHLGTEPEGFRRADLDKHRLVPVSLPRERARRHYEGFSNGVLWPLFHYFLESMEFDPEDFEAYRDVNHRFAEVVAEHARPDDQIWIHDYHLMLLPEMLRQQLPTARIGFFLHIPFPSSEVFRVLPVAEEILTGLLGADLIGVHTYDYVRHLATSFRRILGRQHDREVVESDTGRCRLAAFPLGVDASRFAGLAASAAVQRRIAGWQRRVGGRKVILGVDRLDYSKGIPLRLAAYRRLLETEPEWRRELLFLQLAVPTRSNIDQYRRLKQQVEQSVGEINGQFGELGRMPVHYMYRSVTPEELVALYRLADVAMITPLRDGMNLVAKEYVASRVDDTGVLILSQFAGAASELGEAIVVNVWDLDGTVHALSRALRMNPDEQHRRMSNLRRRVSEYDAHRWARSFIEALAVGERGRRVEQVKAREAEWKSRLVRGFSTAKRPLVILDYDGTLRDFDPEPRRALPDPELLALLRDLAASSEVNVLILSGRDRKTLSRWFGDIPVHLSAEHGIFFRSRHNTDWEDLAPALDRSWLPVVEEAMDSYVDRTPGSFIERKHAGLAWHYRKAEPALGLRQGRELAHHLTEYFANRPLRISHGACVVEAQCHEIHKGWAYRTLVERLGMFDFTLVAGDDMTDEDLFKAVSKQVWAIKIGEGVTSARFRLDAASQLRVLLATAVQARLVAHAERTQTQPKARAKTSAESDPAVPRPLSAAHIREDRCD